MRNLTLTEFMIKCGPEAFMHMIRSCGIVKVRRGKTAYLYIYNLDKSRSSSDSDFNVDWVMEFEVTTLPPGFVCDEAICGLDLFEALVEHNLLEDDPWLQVLVEKFNAMMDLGAEFLQLNLDLSAKAEEHRPLLEEVVLTAHDAIGIVRTTSPVRIKPIINELGITILLVTDVEIEQKDRVYDLSATNDLHEDIFLMFFEMMRDLGFAPPTQISMLIHNVPTLSVMITAEMPADIPSPIAYRIAEEAFFELTKADVNEEVEGIEIQSPGGYADVDSTARCN